MKNRTQYPVGRRSDPQKEGNMKTQASTFPSMTTQIQNKVNEAIKDLEIRKARGDDYVDTYEYGFLQAMKLINRAYSLEIEGLE